MAFLGESFSTDTLPESDRSYEAMPAGWYTANISGAELRNTKSGTGKYIAVRYDITGPTHEGRVVFGNLNIQNQNPEAERIGRQQLGELMRAIGLAVVEDTDQLIGGTLSIKLKVRKSDEYGDSNDVSGFKALGGAAAPKPAAKASASSPAAANGKKAPWQK